MSGRQQDSAMGGSLEARNKAPLGRSFVEGPVERAGTSNSEAVEPARLAGDDR
jgi:hypothetical protein